MKKYLAFLGAIFIIVLHICFSKGFDYREVSGFTGGMSEYMNNYNVDANKVSAFEKSIINSKRENLLILGIEGEARTDVIIFLSFDSKINRLDIISIPRDTYYYEKGYENGDQRKINAAYGRRKEKGSMEAAGRILGGLPINNYVSLEYEGVEAIVDALGGIEIEVPCYMEVGGVEINEGLQKLDGKQALQFLRFRKGYRDGDLGRIKVHQKFIDKVINKLFSSDFLEIIKACYGSIKTNMSIEEIIAYAKHMKGIKKENISMKILPGKAEYKEFGGKNWSFYFHDPIETKELMKTIFYIYKKNILEME